MQTESSLHALPLFPLSTVLFPGGLLPLRIFEVRYLDMIRRCHTNGTPFGVVALTTGREVQKAGTENEVFQDVGTLARIDTFESVQPGLIEVSCVGMQRFRIDRRERLRHGLWVADAQLIPDDIVVPVPDDLQGDAEALANLIETLQQRIDVPDAPPLPIAPPYDLNDCGWVANRWCELLPLPTSLKHQLMALENPVVRLELVGDILARNGVA